MRQRRARTWIASRVAEREHEGQRGQSADAADLSQQFRLRVFLAGQRLDLLVVVVDRLRELLNRREQPAQRGLQRGGQRLLVEATRRAASTS
jgi:hypothetical protein